MPAITIEPMAATVAGLEPDTAAKTLDLVAQGASEASCHHRGVRRCSDRDPALRRPAAREALIKRQRSSRDLEVIIVLRVIEGAKILEMQLEEAPPKLFPSFWFQ